MQYVQAIPAILFRGSGSQMIFLNVMFVVLFKSIALMLVCYIAVVVFFLSLLIVLIFVMQKLVLEGWLIKNGLQVLV